MVNPLVTHVGIATCDHPGFNEDLREVLMADIAYAQNFELNDDGRFAIVEQMREDQGRALSATDQEETGLSNFLSEATAITKIFSPIIAVLVIFAMWESRKAKHTYKRRNK